MARILLTAYEPYDDWETNVSQLVLDQLQAASVRQHDLAARVYPVAFSRIHQVLSEDLSSGYDYAVHMGQAPGYSAVTLESIGVNVAVDRGQLADEGGPLVPGGAAAYQSQLPLGAWAEGLRAEGIPASVSHHAGTYLCNAALYLSCYEAQRRGLGSRSVFLHLPLATEQVAVCRRILPSLPLERTVSAVRWILGQLA